MHCSCARGEQSPKLHLQGIATHFCCSRRGTSGIEKGNLDNQTALQKQRFDAVVEAIHAKASGSMPSSRRVRATRSAS